jgi:hypothetical protein
VRRAAHTATTRPAPGSLPRTDSAWAQVARDERFRLFCGRFAEPVTGTCEALARARPGGAPDGWN